jgi:hypothetical protein
MESREVSALFNFAHYIKTRQSKAQRNCALTENLTHLLARHALANFRSRIGARLFKAGRGSAVYPAGPLNPATILQDLALT